MKPVQKPLVHKRIEEIHFLRRLFQHITYHILQHSLRQHHVIIQICKCHLRLYHPELRRMSRRIRVLRAESRSESVNIAECLGISLAV